MEYRFLTPDQQAAMLRQRLASLEAEHYHHQINCRIGSELAKATNTVHLEEARKMIAEAEAAQALIETAYAVTTAELAALQDRIEPTEAIGHVVGAS